MEFLALKFQPKPGQMFTLWQTTGQYWLIRQSQAQKCFITLNLCIKLLLKFLFNTIFYWLTIWLADWLHDYLMPSDNHNSEMAKATGLISSLILVASSQNMLFTKHSSSNARIIILLKLTFVLHSFLHYRIGNDLQ